MLSGLIPNTYHILNLLFVSDYLSNIYLCHLNVSPMRAGTLPVVLKMMSPIPSNIGLADQQRVVGSMDGNRNSTCGGMKTLQSLAWGPGMSSHVV